MKPSRPKAKPKAARKPEGKARIRIGEHVVMRAGDLIPNPLNWRTHPPAQVDALRAVFAEVGVVSEVLAVRTRRGVMLIDGHLRADLDADQELPVAILDLTPAEQRKVLGTYDVIGAMAERDDPKFAALLAGMDAHSEDFRRVIVEFEATVGKIGTMDMPALPDGDRAPFQQMTFTLSAAQAEIVTVAIHAAKTAAEFTTDNENSNGNALARIAEAFIG